MTREKTKRVFIDTKQAVKNGVDGHQIISEVEKYFGYKYWNRWFTTYRYLLISHEHPSPINYHIKGEMFLSSYNHKADNIEIIDWYDISPLSFEELKNLDNTDFNEELL